MEEMEKELSPAGFIRIHKSYLVNMQHIKKLNYDRAQLSDDTILPVSQKKFSEIKLRYMNWKAQQWTHFFLLPYGYQSIFSIHIYSSILFSQKGAIVSGVFYYFPYLQLLALFC